MFDRVYLSDAVAVYCVAVNNNYNVSCTYTQVRDTDLVALACDDKVVRLYDLATRKLVRRLEGHTNHLTDMCFTPDARRLVTSSMDHTVR